MTPKEEARQISHSQVEKRMQKLSKRLGIPSSRTESTSGTASLHFLKKLTKKRKWKKYKKHKIVPLVDYEKVSGSARKVIDIAIKKQTPITDEEKAIAKDIRQAKAKGYFIDLPLE